MVHLSDLDWNRAGDEVIKDYKKGDKVRAVVLDVDREKERISLGIKQLGGDPLDTLAKYKKGDPGHLRSDRRSRRTASRSRSPTPTSRPSSSVPTCRATAPSSAPSVSTSATRSTPPSSRSTSTARRIGVSIKALEIAEEKQAVAQYGSSDSGASLGDILGAAMKQREGDEPAND